MSHLTAFIALIPSIRNDDKGQGLAEYALILDAHRHGLRHRTHLHGAAGQHHASYGRPVRLTSTVANPNRMDRRAFEARRSFVLPTHHSSRRHA